MRTRLGNPPPRLVDAPGGAVGLGPTVVGPVSVGAGHARPDRYPEAHASGSAQEVAHATGIATTRPRKGPLLAEPWA